MSFRAEYTKGVCVLLSLARLAAVVFVAVATVLAASGLVMNRWQFWVCAAAFVLVALGWLRLGHHWVKLNGGSFVVLDKYTAFTASAMILLIGVSALAMSTLG